jgi:hypothetical protein
MDTHSVILPLTGLAVGFVTVIAISLILVFRAEKRNRE